MKIIKAGASVYQKYTSSGTNKVKDIYFIVTELAEVGDLFDLISLPGFMTEKMARHFFK